MTIQNMRFVIAFILGLVGLPLAFPTHAVHAQSFPQTGCNLTIRDPDPVQMDRNCIGNGDWLVTADKAVLLEIFITADTSDDNFDVNGICSRHVEGDPELEQEVVYAHWTNAGPLWVGPGAASKLFHIRGVNTALRLTLQPAPRDGGTGPVTITVTPA
jgi:hypothetical protein